MPSSLLTKVHSDPAARVLVVTNMWPHPGNPKYGIFVKRQVDSLIDAGVPCDVYFLRGHRSPLAYLLAALALAAWNLLPGRRYELVHAHGGESALAVWTYLRAPVLVSYCGDDLLGTPDAAGRISRAHRLRRWLLQQQARMPTATLTKSAEMERTLPAGVRRRNTVIPNGVDAGRFVPIDRAEARRTLGWGEDDRVALFAADPAVERKRHWLALAACERAAEELDGVRLEVASDVQPERMPVLMGAADCLLMTSVHEGSPNVVKEALMCDLPVVAVPVGDVPERLADVEPSWLADGVDGLAEAVLECLREPRRSNGRAAAAELTVERIANRVMDLYRDLTRGGLALPAHGRDDPSSAGLVGTDRRAEG